jgi:hypothetical protein
MIAADHLRAVLAGLLGFAATEEQALLASGPAPSQGSPQQWAAAPLVAHNTEFKDQQVQRLAAIATGQVPPEFGELDHESAEVYRGYANQPAASVAEASWRAAGALIAAVAAVTDADLTDAARNPWLHGRQLWLQIIVRGFWHTSGHLGDYYLAHGQPDRAVALAARGVATAAGLDAPDMARGMAGYNLACAQARSGQWEQAARALTEAIGLNPDIRANASRDPDLAGLRDTGRLAAVLGQ